MKSKFIFLGVLVLTLIASACSPSIPSGGAAEQPAMPRTKDFQIAYIGSDGNVWFHPGIWLEPRRITMDALRIEGSDSVSTAIAYYFPKISSDGKWVAYRRDVTESSAMGMQYTSGLFLFNSITSKSLHVLEEMPAGFDWKPGAHVLAYGLAVPEGYFGGGAHPVNETLARGLRAFDADNGETRALVQPERGYALYNPQWSPDGKLLGFDEVTNMEGRGRFAYYDFQKGDYVAWDESIGNYVFNPHRSQVIYDRLTYVAQGTEDLFTRSIQRGKEQSLTHYDSKTAYPFLPALSPNGDRIAYLVNLKGPDSQTHILMVQKLAGGEPAWLGEFETVLNLAWSPDGKWLIFSAGPWDAQKVMMVNVADGSTTVIGTGTTPDVSG